MSEATTTTNVYEAMFLLPSGAGSDLDATLKLVRGIIERHEGKVIVLKKWDERKLAYELLRQKRGLYVIAYFHAPGTAVSAIERDVNLSDQILRVLVTTADHLNEQEMNAVEPQPIQPREERNPWDRPGFNDRPLYDDRQERGDRAPRAPRARREEGAEAAVGKE
jgi:small subunit ribosomal protein S6